MRTALPVAFAFILCVVFGTASAEAQEEASCHLCEVSPYTYNGYCSDFNGPIPNCRTVCDGYVCSCHRSTWGRCMRGADGTYFYIKIQYVRLPIDEPFHSAFRVTKARMKRQRPA